MRAARSNQIETVKLLASLGANINAQDNDGNSPIIEASKSSFYSLAKELMNFGADPEKRNNLKNKAISYAKYDSKMQAILNRQPSYTVSIKELY